MINQIYRRAFLRLRKMVVKYDHLLYLRIKRVNNPQLSLKIINQLVRKKRSPKKQIFRHNDHRRLMKLIIFRGMHYPLQYLCGEWPFRSLLLKMRRPVFICRYETQYMVGLIIQSIKKQYIPGCSLRILDLGCGSGAIGLSLVKELEEYFIDLEMVDINVQCISLSKANAVKNNLKNKSITYSHSSMEKYYEKLGEYDVIVSNPPYISQGNYPKLPHEVKFFEDKRALVAQNDGLQFIQEIISSFQRTRSSRTRILFLEFGGECLKHIGMESYVLLDQYKLRRFVHYF